MCAAKTYVLDANIFIQAKNSYYAFALCPGFWDSLLGHHEAGTVCSVDRIKRELLRGRDDLADWAKRVVPAAFFHSTQDVAVAARYQGIMTWVQKSPKFFALAKAEFAASADGFLVAYAHLKDYVVVTHEQLRPEARNKVPIPNVCRQFGVDCVDTFQMLRSLKVEFQWRDSD